MVIGTKKFLQMTNMKNMKNRMNVDTVRRSRKLVIELICFRMVKGPQQHRVNLTHLLTDKFQNLQVHTKYLTTRGKNTRTPILIGIGMYYILSSHSISCPICNISCTSLRNFVYSPIDHDEINIWRGLWLIAIHQHKTTI